MELLLKKLLEIPEAAALAEAVERGDCPAAVTGLSPVHKAQMAAALARAGARVQLEKVEGTFHGFDFFRDTPAARVQIARRADALRRAFGAPSAKKD